MKKSSNRKKYAVGTSITNYIEDPSTALEQDNIAKAKAQFEAQSDPFIQGMKMLGQTSMQVGSALGGFSGIKGLNKDTASLLTNLIPSLTSTATKFADGGTVLDGMDEDSLYKLNKLASKNGMTLEEFISSLNVDGGVSEFALGGQIPKNIPVEVEGDEVGEMPNGQLLDFQGPSHEQGGIDATLPEGTEIYSKRITIDGKTMAERKKGRENILAKYSKRVDKNNDAIDKNTLGRVKVATEKEESFDRQLQDNIHKSLVAQGKSLIGDEDREQHATDPLVGFDYLKPTTYDINTPDIEDLGAPSISLKKPVQEDKTSSGFKFTGGDALNMAGNIFQGVAPYLNTLEQRATDTPNENKFKDYGKEGIDKLSQTEQFHKQVLDDALLGLERNRQSATSNNRKTARGVNTMRALDLASEESANQQQGNLYANYANQMANTMAQEAQMENQQDQVVMQGEQARDLADRQDKDAFYTAKGEGLRNLGMTTANAGKQVNQALERDTMYDLLGTNNFSFDKNTNKIFGKAAQSLGLDLSGIKYPDLIQQAWDKGALSNFSSLEEAQKYYNNLTNPSPDIAVSLIQAATSGKKVTKK